jgi:flagellar hook-length control protein FliK
MGAVRIDSLMNGLKSASTNAAGGKAVGSAGVKKEEQAGAGQGAGFSEALAKAQPKKRGGDEGKAQEPAAKSAPAAGTDKAAKKQVKGKGKDDKKDATPVDGSAAHQSGDSVTGEDEAASPTAVDAEGDVTSDDSADDSADGDGASPVLEGKTPVVPDPTQVLAAAQAAVANPVPAAVPATSAETPAAGPLGAGSAEPVRPVRAAKQDAGTDAKQVADEGADQAVVATADEGEQKEPGKDEGVVAHPEADATAAAAGVARPKEAVRPVAERGQADADNGGDAEGTGVGVQAQGNKVAAKDLAAPVARFTELFRQFADHSGERDGEGKTAEKVTSPTDVMLATVAGEHNATKAPATPHVQAAPAVPATPEVRFAEENHPKVVTAVKAQMVPGGGAIQLRLDPPDLGPLRLEVRMEDGAMSASFVTANEQATSLLTHTLGQLKHALEGAGISVDKLQVRQGSKDQFADNSDQQRQQQGGMAGDQSSARQEQQRREMLNRMWRKVAGEDPVDLVA